jgi:hypothetical protein
MALVTGGKSEQSEEPTTICTGRSAIRASAIYPDSIQFPVGSLQQLREKSAPGNAARASEFDDEAGEIRLVLNCPRGQISEAVNVRCQNDNLAFDIESAAFQ